MKSITQVTLQNKKTLKIYFQIQHIASRCSIFLLCTATYLNCLFLIFKHISTIYTHTFLPFFYPKSNVQCSCGAGKRTSFLRHEQTNRKEQKMTQKKSLMDFSFSSSLSLVIFYIALDKHKFLFPPKKRRLKKRKNPFLTCEFNEAASTATISLRMTKKLFSEENI